MKQGVQTNRGTTNTQWFQPPVMVPMETQPSNQGQGNSVTWPDPEVNRRGRLPECDTRSNRYATNILYDGRPLSVNDIDRPVFVNHYYAAGELPTQLTSKNLIRIDECDEPLTDSSRSYQTQIPIGTQPQGTIHECVELSQDSMGMPTLTKNIGTIPFQKEHQRGFHSKLIEHSQHSPGIVSIGKS